jgi:hypothetical protein
MPASPESVEPITLEIRLLDRTEAGYPIEMTLTNTQQVFSGYLAADVLPWTATGNAQSDGQKLFNALFANSELVRGWGVVQDKSKRLRLRIDAVKLNALPWELLCDQIDLLAADADTPFSRYLAVSRAWGMAIDERPIRILAVISNPIDLKDRYPDLEPADVKAETQALQTAIGSAAQLDFLTAPVTLDRLETELRKGYHILHFIGHGAFSENKKQAALLMQDADGKVRLARDVDFAGMLNRLQAPPHLVVLAACQSAKQSSSAAFTGLGPQLVQIGLPAVIAMQENVTVDTARQFATTFYQRLLEHGTVDLAMNEARGTLITNGRFDAAVPVLFMRLPDGRLWGIDTAKKTKSQQESTTMSDKGRSGGINFGAGSKVKIGGDAVAGDKKTNISGDQVSGNKTTVNTGGGAYVGGNVNVSGGSKFIGRDDNSTTGLSAKEVAQLFDSIYQKIDAKANLDPSDKEDLKTTAQDVQAEVAKGEEANENSLARHLRNIKRIAPDILEVIVNTFADPALGVATVVRKVMAKAQAELKA